MTAAVREEQQGLVQREIERAQREQQAQVRQIWAEALEQRYAADDVFFKTHYKHEAAKRVEASSEAKPLTISATRYGVLSAIHMSGQNATPSRAMGPSVLAYLPSLCLIFDFGVHVEVVKQLICMHIVFCIK